MISKLKSLLYQGYIWNAAKLRTRVRWRGPVAMDFPRLFYGRDHIPGQDENACGGIIKVQDLQTAYPNHNRGANILYLVSSALPALAPDMVRYAKKYGAKLVLNQNGTAYPAWHGPGWERTNLPLRQVMGMADYVFYQSEFCKKAADLYLTPRDDLFEVLHNPVDTARFIPVKRKLGGHKLISAGTHNQLYRVKCAVETVGILKREIPDIHLTFAGQYYWHSNPDQARAELVEMVRKLDLDEHISIQGKYSQNEIVRLLQDHHIFLHTKYNDPCPRSVSEALACGLPVVHSCSGGVPELVSPNAGVGVAAPLDWLEIHVPAPQDLAKGIIRVFSDYEKYSTAARRQGVSKLDVLPWINRHKEIFQEMIS